MTCNEIQEHISAYIDRECSADSAAVMFVHLSGCMACQGFLTDSLRVRAVLHSPPTLAPAPIRRRQEAPRGPLRSLIAQRLELPFAAAAGLALVLLSVSLLSLSLWLNPPKGKPPQREVVYMLSLPPVEVRAAQPADQKPVE